MDNCRNCGRLCSKGDRCSTLACVIGEEREAASARKRREEGEAMREEWCKAHGVPTGYLQPRVIY